jgi:hypothetical protein
LDSKGSLPLPISNGTGNNSQSHQDSTNRLPNNIRNFQSSSPASSNNNFQGLNLNDSNQLLEQIKNVFQQQQQQQSSNSQANFVITQANNSNNNIDLQGLHDQLKRNSTGNGDLRQDINLFDQSRFPSSLLDQNRSSDISSNNDINSSLAAQLFSLSNLLPQLKQGSNSNNPYDLLGSINGNYPNQGYLDQHQARNRSTSNDRGNTPQSKSNVNNSIQNLVPNIKQKEKPQQSASQQQQQQQGNQGNGSNSSFNVSNLLGNTMQMYLNQLQGNNGSMAVGNGGQGMQSQSNNRRREDQNIDNNLPEEIRLALERFQNNSKKG